MKNGEKIRGKGNSRFATGKKFVNDQGCWNELHKLFRQTR